MIFCRAIPYNTSLRDGIIVHSFVDTNDVEGSSCGSIPFQTSSAGACS